MPIEIKMPALSPTMEEGTLAKWLVKPGDSVSPGDVLAEIETDKATMEFETIDEGTIAAIAVEAGTEGVAVGTVIATLAEEGEDVDAAAQADAKSAEEPAEPSKSESAPAGESAEEGASSNEKKEEPAGGSDIPASPSARKLAQASGIDLATVTGTGPDGRVIKSDIEALVDAGGAGSLAPAAAPAPEAPAAAQAPPSDSGERIVASPLARRIAEANGIDLSRVKGSGPNGRIVKADVEGVEPAKASPSPAAATPTAPPAQTAPAAAEAPEGMEMSEFGAPYKASKLNNIRKIIAKRLTEAKQTIPHIYLTLDVQLDALLKLRGELNEALEADGIKLSVNDLLIKALAKALLRVPACNVSFQGDTLREYARADISVAVAAPSGLITPIIVDAGSKPVSVIATEMKELAGKARDGKLQPHEFQGGTASLSNLGMFGIKQFDAVINPPQAMILAVGAGEKRPHVVDGALSVATVMSATGSFDHRAIDGADGAQLMQAFQQIVENPLGMLA